MILNKGLWINIELDGIDGAIAVTHDDKVFLSLFGPERVLNDIYSKYSPFDELSKDDNSDFAILYRKLDLLVQNKKLDGPYGDNHPTMFYRFEYFNESTPVELLTLLETNGIIVRIQRMDHKGDEVEVEKTTRDFAKWIDAETVFEPDPKIEARRQEEEWNKKSDEIFEEHKKGTKEWIRQNRLKFLTKKIIGVLILGGIISVSFWLHWIFGTAVTLFTGYFLWWYFKPV